MKDALGTNAKTDRWTFPVASFLRSVINVILHAMNNATNFYRFNLVSENSLRSSSAQDEGSEGCIQVQVP